MTRRTPFLCIALLFFLLCAQVPAQTAQDLDSAWLGQLADQGWAPAGDGLLRTELPDGSHRLMAYNAAGLEVAVERLQMRLNFALRKHFDNPRDDSRNVVARYLALIEKLEARIATGWTATPITPKATNCEFDVDAAVTSSSCTQTSSATASYTGSCFGECSAHTFVYIQRLDCDGHEDENWHFCDSEEGNDVICTGSVSSSSLLVHPTAKSCRGYAEAYLDCEFGLNFPEEFGETARCPFKCGYCELPGEPGPGPEPVDG